MEEQKTKREWTISVCGIHLLLAIVLNEIIAALGSESSCMAIFRNLHNVSRFPFCTFGQIVSFVPGIFFMLLILAQLLPQKAQTGIRVAIGIVAAVAFLSVLSGFVSFFVERDMPYVLAGMWTYNVNPALMVFAYSERILIAIAYLRIAKVLLKKDDSKISDFRGLRIITFVYVGAFIFAGLVAGDADLLMDMFLRYVKTIFLIHALTRLPVTFVKREQVTCYAVKKVVFVAVALAFLLGIGVLINRTPSGNSSDKGGACTICGEHTRWIYRNGRWFCRSCSKALD